jgi:hypothetical protein
VDDPVVTPVPPPNGEPQVREAEEDIDMNGIMGKLPPILY